MEKDWLTNRDNKKGDRLKKRINEREIGSQTATIRRRWLTERNNERKIGSQTRERQRVIWSHSQSKRLTFLAYLNIFVAKQLNKTFLCRDTLKNGTFCPKLLNTL